MNSETCVKGEVHDHMAVKTFPTQKFPPHFVTTCSKKNPRSRNPQDGKKLIIEEQTLSTWATKGNPLGLAGSLGKWHLNTSLSPDEEITGRCVKPNQKVLIT